MWWHNGFSWGAWVVMTLFMVAFWALVVYAFAALFRSNGRDARGTGDGSAAGDPLQILDERFARGDIDVDEYHARRHTLRTAR